MKSSTSGVSVARLPPPFPVSPTVRWIALLKEMLEHPEQKIGRPRQLYVGATARDYTPVGER